jgi:N-acetylmannosamine-6-phosphate 2-epimerase/N-acetylmannosamine kinase
MTARLAIDVGGTKTLVALVDGASVLAEVQTATARDAGAGAWCDAIADAARSWTGRFDRAGAAVSGVIADGRWSAMNPKTLPAPECFPLAEELASRLACEVSCFNDAQAAAWGEYRFGAGEGRDLVFVTVSTGIGGGAVVNGKLLIGRSGLGCSAGLTRIGKGFDSDRIEDVCAGRWISEAARAVGRNVDTPGVFAAADADESWAIEIVEQSADAVANLLANLQLLFDPPAIVVGGGVGLADGYLRRLDARLDRQPALCRPELRLAALGRHAGAIGAADLAV